MFYDKYAYILMPWDAVGDVGCHGVIKRTARSPGDYYQAAQGTRLTQHTKKKITMVCRMKQYIFIKYSDESPAM